MRGAWLEFQEELPNLKDIRVSRWLPDHCRHTEIHGFADASERAYAAVAYVRSEDRSGAIQVRLIAAKTKVAPLKQVTLPRLELCAATLLVRLVTYVQRTLELNGPPHLWSDSTVALGWIRGHPSSWKTYVANRVSEIQTMLPNATWHHTPGRDNPADCASRGLSPRELFRHPLWWNGPSWLRERQGPWMPACDTALDGELPERRTGVHSAATERAEILEPEMLTRFSSLRRLLRVTAWCLRWRRCTEGPPTVREGRPEPPVLQVVELEEARRVWLRLVQAADFRAEMTALIAGKELSARTGLAKLSPFQAADGLMRVGGRLRHAQLSHDQRHPVILPGGSRFTRLVIEACHRRTLHGGVQLTLEAVRQDWVPRGRALVKGCIHHCHTCVRWRAASLQPLMGDLPSPRVRPSRPFSHTGVDYAGPVWIRSSRGRGHKASKAFLVIFVCFSSRAVHLDAASDYSADVFPAALRRFVARRGLCQSLYSDCGTNFIGADAQLRRMFTAGSREGRQIADHLAKDRIQWHFNPPAAPNFGGLWEAAVKSAKYHLRRVVGEAKLTYEEMATLLTQIEACLNSRPLQALSDDPEDLTALTPGHFLIGEPLNAIPEPSLAEVSRASLAGSYYRG